MNILDNEANNLELLFNTSPISMLLLNEDSQLEIINDAALRFLKIIREEVLGRHYCHAVCCKDGVEDDRECGLGLQCRQVCELRLAIDSVFESGLAILDFEYSNLLIQEGNQSEFWFCSSITPIMIGGKRKAVLALVNITERKQAEIALRAKEQSYELLLKKYHALVMNIPNCLAYNKVISDEAGNPIDYQIIEVNKAYEETLKISSKDIVGKRYSELFSSLDPQTYERSMADYREVALFGISKVLPLVYCDWCCHWVSVGIYSTEPGYFVSIYTDMTEHKLMKNGLKHKKDADDTNRVQYGLWANISREIRNSINGIEGMIDLTLLTELSNEQEASLKSVKYSAEQLLKIITSYQDFTKLEAQDLVIDQIGVNVRDLLEEMIEESSPAAIKKGIKLNYTCTADVPQIVLGNRKQLKQVLDNLLDNALKFTDKGQVILAVTRIAEPKKTNVVKFSVTDSGIGISEEEQALLFRPFNQTNGSISKDYNSIGLGLYVTRKLIQKMGGTIWVESERGSGSSFHFTLKLRVQHVSNKNSFFSTIPSLPVKSLQILVVEDEPVNITILKHMLKGKAHTILTAANGSEALVLHGQKLFDVIIMDIQMPIMDGIEATVRIREKEGLSRHTPIIALTAYALPRDREKLLTYGMDEYISKPIKMEELFLKIEQVVARFKSSNDAARID